MTEDNLDKFFEELQKDRKKEQKRKQKQREKFLKENQESKLTITTGKRIKEDSKYYQEIKIQNKKYKIKWTKNKEKSMERKNEKMEEHIRNYIKKKKDKRYYFVEVLETTNKEKYYIMYKTEYQRKKQINKLKNNLLSEYGVINIDLRSIAIIRKPYQAYYFSLR